MKKVYGIILLLLFTGISIISNAQSIVGSWKMTEYFFVYADGSKEDMFSKASKTIPCYPNIIYSFLTNGKTSEKMDGCNDFMVENVKSLLHGVTWKVIGNKLIYESADITSPPNNHGELELEFSGNNKMTLTKTLTTAQISHIDRGRDSLSNLMHGFNKQQKNSLKDKMFKRSLRQMVYTYVRQ